MPRQAQTPASAPSVGAFAGPTVLPQVVGLPDEAAPSPLAQLASLLGATGETVLKLRENQKERDEAVALEKWRQEQDRKARAEDYRSMLKGEIARRRVGLTQATTFEELDTIESELLSMFNQNPEHADLFDESLRDVNSRRRVLQNEIESHTQGLQDKAWDDLSFDIRSQFESIQTTTGLAEFEEGYTQWSRQRSSAGQSATPEEYLASLLRQGVNSGLQEAGFQDDRLTELWTNRLRVSGEVTGFAERWFNYREGLQQEAVELEFQRELSRAGRELFSGPIPDAQSYVDRVRAATALRFPGRDSVQRQHNLDATVSAGKRAANSGRLDVLLALRSAVPEGDQDLWWSLVVGEQSDTEFLQAAVDNHLGRYKPKITRWAHQHRPRFTSVTTPEEADAMFAEMEAALQEQVDLQLEGLKGRPGYDQVADMLNVRRRQMVDQIMEEIRVESLADVEKRRVAQFGADQAARSRLILSRQQAVHDAARRVAEAQTPEAVEAAQAALQAARNEVASLTAQYPSRAWTDQEINSFLENTTWFTRFDDVLSDRSTTRFAAKELAAGLRGSRTTTLPAKVKEEISRLVNSTDTREAVAGAYLAYELSLHADVAFDKAFPIQSADENTRTQSFRVRLAMHEVSRGRGLTAPTADGTDPFADLVAKIQNVNPADLPNHIANDFQGIGRDLVSLKNWDVEADQIALVGSGHLYSALQRVYGPGVFNQDVGDFADSRGRIVVDEPDELLDDTEAHAQLLSLFEGQKYIVDDIFMNARIYASDPNVSLDQGIFMAVQEARGVHRLKFVNEGDRITPIYDPYDAVPSDPALFQAVKRAALREVLGRLKEDHEYRESWMTQHKWNPWFPGATGSPFDDEKRWDLRLDRRRQLADASPLGLPVELVDRQTGDTFPLQYPDPYFLNQRDFSTQELIPPTDAPEAPRFVRFRTLGSGL